MYNFPPALKKTEYSVSPVLFTKLFYKDFLMHPDLNWYTMIGRINVLGIHGNWHYLMSSCNRSDELNTMCLATKLQFHQILIAASVADVV